MSREIVERYRKANDAWNRGALDEWLADITPGWELVLAGVFPDLAPVYRGREGALELWETVRGPWERHGFHLQIERIEELGDEVLALLTMRATGQESGKRLGVPALERATIALYRSAALSFRAA
jgi:SnoaL-like domain